SDFEKIKTAAAAVSEIESVVGELVQDAAFEGNTEEEPASTETEIKTEAPAVAATSAPAPAKTEKKAPAGKGKGNAKPVTNRTIRVDIEKLDALMNQVSELIIAKNSLVSIGMADDDGEDHSQSFHEQIEYLERITTNLHESVMKVRMVPIESVVNKFPRMIRDLSKTLNKKMELEMTGEDTELDRTVVDQLGDPLQHLLRNSADHGLESAEVRKERGKSEVGTIFLNAFQEGNNVIIEVGDDGNGIDTESVKAKAIERGLVTPEAAEQLSQKEIIDFLFMPSFSMAKQISDISGRGVGLDVVKSNIEALGGDVEVTSKLGEGSKFIVRLPLTLAIIQALMVEIRDEKYAIALASIQTIEYISTNDIKYVESKEVIHIRGAVIPLIRMDQELDFEPVEDDENLTVVIVQKGDKTAGLVIDNLIGQQEIVIKSLGAYISTTKLISGATILGDGEVALILDVNTLM
ncbi:MAG: chemotaxis protein CheA, partial [Lachnospiraceae bacterium]